MKASRFVMVALLGAVLLPAFTHPSLAGGGRCLSCAVNDFSWQNRQNGARDSIIQQVDQLASSVSTESQITNEALIAAVKTLTRQVSLVGEQEAKATRQAAQAATQVYRDAIVSRQINEARRQFGGEGQMVGACETNTMLSTVSLAMTARDNRIGEIMASPALLATPGSGYTREDGIAMRMRADSPQAVSPIAFLDPATPSWAKDAFMNNLVALPSQSAPMGNPAGPPSGPTPLPRGVAGPDGPDGPEDPDGPDGPEPGEGSLTGLLTPLSPFAPGSIDDLFAQAEFRRRAALRDPAITALAAVRAAGELAPIHEHLGVEPPEGEEQGGVTFTTAMRTLFNEYGGGEGYQEWSASLTGKSEHGLLAEIARLRAISAQLSGRRMETAARRQAIMGVMIAGDAR